MQTKPVYLAHLENSITDSVSGYSTTFYSIALEGWRRGLTLTFINRNRRKGDVYYELSSKNKVHRFTSSRGDLSSAEALRICKDKYEAKKYLKRANVPTPDAKLFMKNVDDNQIISYANDKGYPLVIKPVDGTGGHGVIAGIKNEREFKDALSHVRDNLGFKSIIVEDYFQGEDLRIYVVGDEAVGVTKRIPANVIGNGKDSVRTLINEKNVIRKKSPILGASLIKVDHELKQMLEQQKLSLDSVVPKGRIVYLKSKNNVTAGGDPIDITDEISDEIKNIAVDAVKAIPNLPNAGVDLMANLEKNKATVIEINSQANIRTHLFPLGGMARDVPKKIIDYYFPETKNNPKNTNVYFDFEPVWSKFKEGKIDKYVLPTLPTRDVALTRFIVTGDVYHTNYGAWVRRQARDLKLNGYVKHLKNNQLSIVVSGKEKSIDQFREIVNSESSKRAKIIDVKEKERKTPVKLGFTIQNPELDKVIKDGYHPVQLKGISKLGRYKKRGSKKIKKDNIYERELKKVYSSTSWRITKPLRLIGRILKKSKK